ncbi:MAG TPA: glycosyltransferase family 2 protein [Trichocoleus sp.]|jgi:glycosyltransferase involved in cell wall biosynthesis
MKVSVITVCKNSEKTIDQAIRSVMNQRYLELEYIVVDGDSTDGTKAIIDQYADRVAHYISEPDRGIYAAMNKGIQLATGSFLYFLNSDDYLYDADVIKDLVEFAKSHPNCDLIYGDHEARFLNGDTAIYQPVLPEAMLAEFICLGDNHLHQPTSFFRANLFERVGLFNETRKITSDYEWFLNFLQDSTLKLCYYPRPIVSYAHGGASSNIRSLFEEIFAIQNQSSICQETRWLLKRLDKLQTMFVDKYELLESTNLLSIARYRDIQARDTEITTLKTRLAEKRQDESLQAEIAALKSEINAMKTSKFWQLRTLWFRVKKTIGLPTDD